MPPKFSTASIVLIGAFAPDRYLPNTLVEAKVLSKKDAELARIRTLVAGTVLEYQLPWGEVMATQDRLQVTALEAPHVRSCDFVSKALQDKPKGHTVTQFGINFECHYEFDKVATRDAFACKLVSLPSWGSWGQSVLASMKGPPATHGGLALLQLRAPFAEDKVTGWLDIFVGPSPRIPAGLGVFLRTNHHHQVPIKSSDSGPAKQEAEASDPLALVDIMAARFDQSIASAQKIFGEVIGQPT